MKRPTYAIPLTGLLFAGCADPIIGSWDATNYDNTPLPINDTANYIDINGNNITCDYTLAISFSADDNFSSKLEVNISLSNCTDPNYNEESQEVYTGAVTVIEKRAKYNINFEGLDSTFECTMVDNAILNCLYDGTNFDFALSE